MFGGPTTEDSLVTRNRKPIQLAVSWGPRGEHVFIREPERLSGSAGRVSASQLCSHHFDFLLKQAVRPHVLARIDGSLRLLFSQQKSRD